MIKQKPEMILDEMVTQYVFIYPPVKEGQKWFNAGGIQVFVNINNDGKVVGGKIQPKETAAPINCHRLQKTQ